MSDDYDDDHDDGFDKDDTWENEPSRRLSRDMRIAAETLGDHEARFLVDNYYMQQENRKRADSQQRTLGESDEPHAIIQWLAEHSENLENQIRVALDRYTSAHLMGSWMREVHGIGPVIAAGLLAHIYMGPWCSYCHGRNEADHERRLKIRDKKTKKLVFPPHAYHEEKSLPTAGHIYQYAGIAGDGQKPWEKKTRRPFNAQLKTLCWKVGQSFMYQKGNAKCYYGHLYAERKQLEIARNEAGLFAAQAAKKLEQFNIGKNTDAYKFYSAGKLPPAHLDARARRNAVKIFLGNMHNEWYRRRFNEEPPLPYPIAILGHAHQK